MKAETIAAVAKKLTAGLKEDEIWRKTTLGAKSIRTAKVLHAEEGPRITAAELARLVDMRLRQRGVLAKDSAEAMVEEIEATLDLVEACEVMLVNRREQWKTTVSGLKQAIINDDDVVSERVKGIRAATYPMKFEAGLIRMGVPERGREDKYWTFFKENYAKWQWVGVAPEGQSLSEFIESCPFTDDEIRESFTHCKALGWPNASRLEQYEGLWRRWWAKHKHDGQRAGGIKSVKARAKKKAKVTAQPSRPVKRSNR